DIAWAYPVPGRKDHLTLPDLAAGRVDVLARGDCFSRAQGIPFRDDVLDHDDGIVTGRDRVPGVHPVRIREPYRVRSARAGGLPAPDGKTVSCRDVPHGVGQS